MPPRLAACQLLDRQENIAVAVATLCERADAAAALGAELVCFPEAYLAGYTRDPVVGRRRAFDLDSAAFRNVLRAVADCRPTLVIGLLELCGPQLFNTAIVVKRGRLIGSYRKRHPQEHGFTPGVDLPVFTVSGLRFGLGICSDARDHDDAAQLAAQGVDAILYPLNNMLTIDVADHWRSKHLEILIQRARQTTTWILSADIVGTQDDKVSYGCTAAIDPTGTPREQVPEMRAGMIVVELA